MERRRQKRKEWIVGTDDVGQPMLQWEVERRNTARPESDPLARTYNFLKRLEVPELELAEDPVVEGFDPYDSGVYCVKR